jgi:hypothetical protein
MLRTRAPRCGQMTEQRDPTDTELRDLIMNFLV